MMKECRRSLISFLVSTAMMGVFFFSLPLDFEGRVFLTLAPVFLAMLGLIGGWGTALWLIIVCILFCPIIIHHMIHPKAYSRAFGFILLLTLPYLWKTGYESAEKCLISKGILKKL